MASRVLSTAVVLGVVATAPLHPASARSSASARRFVGRIAGSDAFVGILEIDGAVTAYVCDGRGIAEWFHGPLVRGPLELTSGDGARLTVTRGRKGVTGTFQLPGDTALKYVAQRAAGAAGVYRNELTIGSDTYVGGWIVLADGEQRGLYFCGSCIQQYFSVLLFYPTAPCGRCQCPFQCFPP